MPCSAEEWLVLLNERVGRLDRTLLRTLAQLLGRPDIPQDALLIAADALEESAGECVVSGRSLDALPLRLLRNLLIREAETRKGSFW